MSIDGEITWDKFSPELLALADGLYKPVFCSLDVAAAKAAHLALRY
jgi:hypothetical protein